MTWEVIAEKPRGERGWPTKLDPVFDIARREVEAGTHIMCTRFVTRLNPDTWEDEEYEQRVKKECADPLEPFKFWSEPKGMAIYAGQR